MPGWLRGLKIKLVSLVENGANQASDIVLAKSADMTTTTGNTTQATITLERTMADEKLIPEIQKAVETAVATAVKDRDEKIAALTKSQEDSEKLVAKLQQDRVRDGNIARAKALELPGASPDDFAGILEAAERGMTDEQRTKFDTMLKSWSAAIKTSPIFTEAGASGSGVTGAEQKLDVLAKSLQQADPKLTYQKAYAKAVKDNPALYQQYRAEKGGR